MKGDKEVGGMGPAGLAFGEMAMPRLNRPAKRLLAIALALCLGLLFATTTLAGLGQHAPNGQAAGGGRGRDSAAAIQTSDRGLVMMVPTGTFTDRVYLPIIIASPITAPYDMVKFLVGDQRLYEVQHSSGSQARHQTQITEEGFYHTKGDEISAEWEELWFAEGYIYRGTDTSPGDGLYYTLRDKGMYGSAWAPRNWNVGDVFERNPLVTFYKKSDCTAVVEGRQRSWLLFEKYYARYTFESGITLDNVVQLAWLAAPPGEEGGEPAGEPVERYYYAEQYGLVGWWSRNQGMSYISEIHAPGARPDNTREVIACLDRAPLPGRRMPAGELPYWPGGHRR